MERHGRMADAVSHVLDMQSQAAMIAAAGITIERAAWYRLDELVAIANQLEPTKLDKQLEEIAGTLMATMQRAGVTTRSDLAYSARSRSEERSKPLGGITL